MLFEWFNTIVALGLFFLPGLAILRNRAIPSLAVRVGLAIVLSLAICGSIYYFVSLFFPITPLISYGIFFLSLFWLHHQKVEFHPILPASFPTDVRAKIIFLFLAGGLILLGFISFGFPLLVEDNSYDTLSYHLPFIEQFADAGQVLLKPMIENNVDRLTNYFPKLFEALIGGIRQLSFVYIFIPFLVYCACVLLIWGLTSRMRGSSLWGSIFFVGTPFVFFQFVTFYLDGFLSLLLLGVIWFLVCFEKTKDVAWLELAALLSGSLVATKVGSIGFVLLVLFFYHKYFLKAASTVLIYFIAGGGYFLGYILTVPRASWGSMAGLNGTLISGDLGAKILENGVHLAEVFVIENISFNFFPLVIIGIVYGIWLSIKERSPIHRLYAASLALFVLFILFTEANYRIDSFPRYFLPLYAWSCVYFSVWVERVITHRSFVFSPRIIIIVLTVLSLALLFSTAFLYVSHLNSRVQGVTLFDSVVQVLSLIPNESESVIYFANTPNGITKGLEKTLQRDYLSYPSIANADACSFLRQAGVNYLVVFYPQSPRNDLGSFNVSVVASAQKKECGTLLGESSSFMSLYSIE